ncbi:TPA: inositol phosphorylceramide synthase [Escherichia albertii]|uniref:phosphatase PAP2 family protein n=1 Tax=Escherichia albertii TaxID=208962 RepID=UPI00235EE6C5|nr:phosphatase PAP2 family protein [Escherichia albertii]WDC32657.1 phosphatase PAP2 family protein [Escherichia albertii]HEB1318652.1 inositol phosphorylceramide synthase [Escherichia albertii]HEB1323488.1 inositol phosphorylceramide synthase [Escherichia albertii]HEB1337259.1 inositol phosphorylceramide synthase [Escherichia albertii]HEB1350622.1 inositol phosphorylceramide synthase [Escherichia albertii]
MSNLLLRLKQMLLGWGTVGVIYNFSDYLQGEGYQLTPSVIDNLIAFSPSAVWLYLSFFFIVPLGYLSTPLCHLRWLARAMQLSALAAGMFYLLWPTTMQYPTFGQSGISAGALNGLIAIDSSQNCFPSLHAALTLLAVWAIAKKDNRWLTLMSVVWAIAIAFSILQLRRHLFIDLVGGALLASGCGWIAARLDMRNKQERKTNHE